MKKLLRKDRTNRSAFRDIEMKNFILKSIVKNTDISSSVKLNATHVLISQNKKGSIVKKNNRCLLTARKSSVDSKLKLSRTVLFKSASRGLISGFKKLSW